MTRDETIKVLAILKAAYPNSYKGMTRDEANGTIMIWAAQFSTVPAYIIIMAVNETIKKRNFPPSIFEMRDELKKIYWDAVFERKLFESGSIIIDEKKQAQLSEIETACGIYGCTKSEPLLTERIEAGNAAKMLEGGSQ